MAQPKEWIDHWNGLSNASALYMTFRLPLTGWLSWLGIGEIAEIEYQVEAWGQLCWGSDKAYYAVSVYRGRVMELGGFGPPSGSRWIRWRCELHGTPTDDFPIKGVPTEDEQRRFQIAAGLETTER